MADQNIPMFPPELTALLALLGNKWTVPALIVLGNDARKPVRFGVLRNHMPGSSARMTAETLRHLQEAELVIRDEKTGGQLHVTYTLTERGRDVHAALAYFSGFLFGKGVRRA